MWLGVVILKLLFPPILSLYMVQLDVVKSIQRELLRIMQLKSILIVVKHLLNYCCELLPEQVSKEMKERRKLFQMQRVIGETGKLASYNSRQSTFQLTVQMGLLFALLTSSVSMFLVCTHFTVNSSANCPARLFYCKFYYFRFSVFI